MVCKLEEELSELIEACPGLSITQRSNTYITVSGILTFETKYKDLETINDWFDLEITIPINYPGDLPVVKDRGSKVDNNYEHINFNKTFCLAVPLEEKNVFDQSPNLVGFIDNLVIPFLYSYCYWQKNNEMPYGEMAHGADGLVQYYLDLFDSNDPAVILPLIFKCLKHGYNAHIPCVCGSGKKTLRCHKKETKFILKASNKNQVLSDLCNIYEDIRK